MLFTYILLVRSKYFIYININLKILLQYYTIFSFHELLSTDPIHVFHDGRELFKEGLCVLIVFRLIQFKIEPCSPEILC